jgi:hypothetical protein
MKWPCVQSPHLSKMYKWLFHEVESLIKNLESIQKLQYPKIENLYE